MWSTVWHIVDVHLLVMVVVVMVMVVMKVFMPRVTGEGRGFMQERSEG